MRTQLKKLDRAFGLGHHKTRMSLRGGESLDLQAMNDEDGGNVRPCVLASKHGNAR